MNLPNRLSIIRTVCIPVIVLLLYIQNPGCRIAAGVLFILACITDFLDGWIARSRNLVTDFGKFIDPVADKLLVLTTLVMLVYLRMMPAWVVIIVLCRELSVEHHADPESCLQYILACHDSYCNYGPSDVRLSCGLFCQEPFCSGGKIKPLPVPQLFINSPVN